MPVTWHIQTPASGFGALAIVALGAERAEELDKALVRIAGEPLREGSIALRPIAGIDRGLVARWSPTSVFLMPHASPAVLRRLAAALTAAGARPTESPDPRETYPEARSLLEAHVLGAIARSASPRAVDLLLDQPRRWAGVAPDRLPAAVDPPLDRLRNRLIDPPLVAAWGPPNVGKSTLVNALAGRSVSIVADEPGTTRDHVGVLLDLGGLVVRYVDTPGVRREGGAPYDAVEAESLGVAARVAGAADLVLAVGDSTAPPPPLPAMDRTAPCGSVLTVATRIDLGPPAGWSCDVRVCARDGRGLVDLVTAVRDRLVPDAAINDPGPWAFWPAPPGAGVLT